MSRVYVHGGKLGDVVWSVPAFIWSRCDEYLLVGAGASRVHWFDPAGVLPVLLHAGINARVAAGGGCVYADDTWVNGDSFHGRFEQVPYASGTRRLNLAERHLLAIGGALEAADFRWLRVEPVRWGHVVFCRTSRYRPRVTTVDYRALLTWAGHRAVFVGLAAEHAAFCAEFCSDLPRVATRDLLDVARVLSGCALFAGNQSGVQAVASALRVPQVLEWCPGQDCCRVGYPGEFYSSAEFFESGGGGL
jgi:hypothetical protein